MNEQKLIEAGTRVRIKMSGIRGTVTGFTKDKLGYAYSIQLDGSGDAHFVDGVARKDFEILFSEHGPPFPLAPPVPLPSGPPKASALPFDSAERKNFPLHRGLLAYFPAALALVAHSSFVNNRKHNPEWDGTGTIHHARGVSGDHKDCILRHLMDADEAEQDGKEAAELEELTACAWRALALLQERAEHYGTRAAPAAKFPKE